MFGLFFDEQIAVYSKPFLMPALIGLYLVTARKRNFWVVLALVFSCIGDLLLIDKENYFVFGLVSFLIAHLVYIKITSEELKKVHWTQVLLGCIPFVLFLAGLLQLLFPNLNSFKIPVVVYGIVISTFGASTLLLYRQERSTENLWLLLGALLFIASDSLIAIHKFYNPQEFYGVIIMTTYILAQFLITKSFISKSYR